jgi:Icc-related predicted phosphoesterase
MKGPFSRNDVREHIGVKILVNEVRVLREREKTRVDCIVIFGPLLHRKNTALTQGYSELTFEE